MYAPLKKPIPSKRFGLHKVLPWRNKKCKAEVHFRCLFLIATYQSYSIRTGQSKNISQMILPFTT